MGHVRSGTTLQEEQSWQVQDLCYIWTHWLFPSSKSNKYELVCPAALKLYKPKTRCMEHMCTTVPQNEGSLCFSSSECFDSNSDHMQSVEKTRQFPLSHTRESDALSELRVLEQSPLSVSLSTLFPSFYFQKLNFYYLLQCMKQLLHSKTNLPSLRHQSLNQVLQGMIYSSNFLAQYVEKPRVNNPFRYQESNNLVSQDSQCDATCLNVFLLDFGNTVSHQASYKPVEIMEIFLIHLSGPYHIICLQKRQFTKIRECQHCNICKIFFKDNPIYFKNESQKKKLPCTPDFRNGGRHTYLEQICIATQFGFHQLARLYLKEKIKRLDFTKALPCCCCCCFYLFVCLWFWILCSQKYHKTIPANLGQKY